MREKQREIVCKMRSEFTLGTQLGRGEKENNGWRTNAVSVASEAMSTKRAREEVFRAETTLVCAAEACIAERIFRFKIVHPLMQRVVTSGLGSVQRIHTGAR